MRNTLALPDNIQELLDRVLRGTSAASSAELRRAVFDHVAALTRNATPTAQLPAAIEPYVRQVALHAYKVLDRDVDSVRASGYSVDDVFEMTVAAAVSAGVARMDIALAALDEDGHAPAP